MAPSSPPEAPTPPARADLAAAGALLGLSLFLLRGALAPGRLPGQALGEGWGRLFVTAQVGRWGEGLAPWGQADLLSWPQGQGFWPTDPLVQLLAVPLSALLGDSAALVAVTVVLLALAGIGAQVLARTLGARPLGGLLAGVLVLHSPLLLQHAADLVVEVLAMGPFALALAAVIRWGRGPGLPPVLLTLALVGVAGTSPYFMVYLALACLPGLLLPARLDHRLLLLALTGAVVSALFLAPLLATEGDRGRLSEAWAGQGYALSPPERVREDGSPQEDALGLGDADLVPPRAAQALLGLPGGAALLLASLLGLLSRDSRRPAALALLFSILGPEPWAALHEAVPALPAWQGPLAELLAQVPLLDRLGNPGRIGALSTLLAAATAALLVKRRPGLFLALGLLALLEGWEQCRLFLPSTAVRVPAGVLERVQGPFVVFPSGEPPTWHARVQPKETLFIAGRAGQPQAGDYGRGGLPADLPVQVRLAREAGAALAVPAWGQAPPQPDTAAAWAALPFGQLLVLEDRLDPDERRRLRAWLGAHAEQQVTNGGWSLWRWPDRFPAPPALPPRPPPDPGSPGSPLPAAPGG